MRNRRHRSWPEHLLDLGHRRIACLSSRETPSQTWAVKRRSSFEEAVGKCPGCNGEELAFERAGQQRRWKSPAQLLTDELRPTAVFAVTDHEAAFVNQAAAELG